MLKGSPSRRRKIIEAGKWDLNKGIKRIRNGKYVGNINIFSQFLNDYKIDCLKQKEKPITVHCDIYNKCIMYYQQ